jgi:ATP-binding cassette subfamily B (MDR/TAP) protein 1
MCAAARRLGAVWGFTSCLVQFVMMAMFVQGFWFGAHLVKSGEVSAGDVMSVFDAPPAPPIARRPSQLLKIVPPRCAGEFVLTDVAFAYPSRPTMLVLQDVSLFLP